MEFPRMEFPEFPPGSRSSADESAEEPYTLSPLAAEVLARQVTAKVIEIEFQLEQMSTPPMDPTEYTSRVRSMHERMVAAAGELEGPTQTWPGGWVLEPVEGSGVRVWSRSTWWMRYFELPGGTRVRDRPGEAHRPVWRTEAGAAAAIPESAAGVLRPRWVAMLAHPALIERDLSVPSTAVSAPVLMHRDWWALRGSPRVVVRDHFADARRYPREGRAALLALPPTEVADLAEQYAPVFADQPALARIPRDWLHLTLWTGYLPRQRAALLMRARRSLPPAFEVEVGPATVNSDGVQLAIYPDGVLRALHHVVGEDLNRDPHSDPDADDDIDEDDEDRDVDELRGTPVPHFWRPHLSLGYTTAATTVDVTGVNHVPDRVPWRISELHLVELEPDLAAGIYRWRHLDVIPLRQSTGPEADAAHADDLLAAACRETIERTLDWPGGDPPPALRETDETWYWLTVSQPAAEPAGESAAQAATRVVMPNYLVRRGWATPVPGVDGAVRVALPHRWAQRLRRMAEHISLLVEAEPRDRPDREFLDRHYPITG